jgi:hypothetical protein
VGLHCGKIGPAFDEDDPVGILRIDVTIVRKASGLTP